MGRGAVAARCPRGLLPTRTIVRVSFVTLCLHQLFGITCIAVGMLLLLWAMMLLRAGRPPVVIIIAILITLIITIVVIAVSSSVTRTSIMLIAVAVAVAVAIACIFCLISVAARRRCAATSRMRTAHSVTIHLVRRIASAKDAIVAHRGTGANMHVAARFAAGLKAPACAVQAACRLPAAMVLGTRGLSVWGGPIGALTVAKQPRVRRLLRRLPIVPARRHVPLAPSLVSVQPARELQHVCMLTCAYVL
jgi:hypothetical protein